MWKVMKTPDGRTAVRSGCHDDCGDDDQQTEAAEPFYDTSPLSAAQRHQST
jgi:hypothetical protein